MRDETAEREIEGYRGLGWERFVRDVDAALDDADTVLRHADMTEGAGRRVGNCDEDALAVDRGHDVGLERPADGCRVPGNCRCHWSVWT